MWAEKDSFNRTLRTHSSSAIVYKFLHELDLLWANGVLNYVNIYGDVDSGNKITC